ncbi:unnamed protein product [Acanthoscelides obtectus]|uniref:Uncharacterized protein n=1 Tax=Acanthoscelides obtectus TaxID=200917 RepID=A0A9P0PV97_ACAOB|nr:unnamed protein product [Acanthoscelides obtectus]CAK1688659.1 hypothetical protein AOBTE_LOCUS36780 [Acanthoscelides obtectus]
MAGNDAGHGAIVRNRDLIDVWIEAPRGNRKQVVYEKILSLIDITDEPSKHLKSNIMKCSQLFGLKMANKWQKVGQSRNRLLQNQTRFVYRINNDSEENTSSDEEQEPPCRSVGRPRVPFEEASKKTKRRRVAELTTDRSANELQFAVNVVSGSNHMRNTEEEIITKIENLIPIEIKTKEGHSYIIEVDMMLTMLDGSVGNVLSETNSTMKCIICGATPKDMITLAGINRPPNVDNYRFGLSTLHCWIRFFECLLHIGYRLPIKSWQIRGPENKAIVEANKKRIQAEFRANLSLIVDKPKPGYGSSNDGNTARIFFHNPQTSSDITGVDRELIEKFAIILGVLASGCAIDMEKFASLEEARNLYIHLYKWYNMPNTVHKVLVHGCEIIDAFCLPIGELSEDALEARYKEVRKHRLSDTRKCARTDTNKDLMRVLLLTSDPFITSKRKVSSKKYKKCNEAVQNYLKRQENDDLGIDLGTITNDTAPSKKSYSD